MDGQSYFFSFYISNNFIEKTLYTHCVHQIFLEKQSPVLTNKEKGNKQSQTKIANH